MDYKAPITVVRKRHFVPGWTICQNVRVRLKLSPITNITQEGVLLLVKECITTLQWCVYGEQIGLVCRHIYKQFPH